MASHGMPQNGWWTDEEWAECLNESIRTFRKKARRYRVPIRRWGNLWIINAQDFYNAIPVDESDFDDDWADE